MNSILISQLLLLPVLGLITWGYIALRPKPLVKEWKRLLNIFDVLLILIGIALCIAGYIWVARIPYGSSTPIWLPVLSTVTTFHIYPMVLVVGWWLRRRIFTQTQYPKV